MDPLRNPSCDSYRRSKDIPIKIFKNKKMQRVEQTEPSTVKDSVNQDVKPRHDISS